jgi:hypothetical protein
MIKIEKCPVCEIINEGEDCELMTIKELDENEPSVCCCHVVLKSIKE